MMSFFRSFVCSFLIVLSALVRIGAQPTATLSGDYTVCPSTPLPLIVMLTGTAPYQLVYSINGLEVSATVNTPDSYTIVANLQELTVFSLVSVSDVNGVGIATGFATVTVQQPPAFNNFSVNCSADMLSYTIAFDVTHVNLTNVDITGITGAYDDVTGAFVSDPIPVGTPYTVTLTDLSLLCSNNTQQGPSPVCACGNSAGVLASASLQLCASETASIAPATGVVVEAGDLQQYQLLDAVGSIVALSATPEFVFDPNSMNYGVAYSIVSVCGNDLGGTVDSNDPCFNVSNGISVTWGFPMTATFTGDTAVCRNQPAHLNIQINNGTPPYSLQYSANMVAQAGVVVPSNTYQYVVTPTVTTTYAATLITDANGCVYGPLTGLVATVTQVDTPMITLPISTTCNLGAETYTFTVNVSNSSGNLSNYTFTGDAGSVSGNSFSSLPKPSGSTFSVTIANPIGCSATVSGVGPTCECTTAAGTLQMATIDVCVNEAATATITTPATLDPEDGVQYILFADINTILTGGILSTSNTPVFNYQLSWGTANTYYIAAIAGDKLPSGAVNLNDPCLAVSNAIPVVFHSLPTATISGAVNICAGEDASFNVNFSGEGPFKFKYLLNGIESPLLTSSLSTFPISSTNIQTDQTFTLSYVEDTYCQGTVSGMATVATTALPELKLVVGRNKICFGDTTSIKFLGQNITSFNAVLTGTDGSLLPIFNQSLSSVNSIQPTQNTTYTLGNVGVTGNNCPLKLDSMVSVIVTKVVANITPTFVGAYHTSCFGESDGIATAAASGGTAPYSYKWSTGGTFSSLLGLAPGTYTVTTTDMNGCKDTVNTTITQPPPIVIGAEASDANCFIDSSGIIAIQTATGLVAPAMIDFGGLVQDITALPMIFDSLLTGTYPFTITDDNGCVYSDTLVVDPPKPILVDLGDDRKVLFGDSAQLLPVITNTDNFTFSWSSTEGFNDPTSLTPYITPFLLADITLTVVDTVTGCVGADEIRLQFEKSRRFFYPTIFRAGETGQNGYFILYFGAEVAHINFTRVYNRWGEQLFEKNDMTPNDYLQGWNGTYKGRRMEEGVYPYVVEAVFIDGSTELFSGDITLIW